MRAIACGKGRREGALINFENPAELGPDGRSTGAQIRRVAAKLQRAIDTPGGVSNLRLDLRTSLWYFFLTAALSFKKGFSTRTLSEFGREPLLPFCQVSTKRGASSTLDA